MILKEVLKTVIPPRQRRTLRRLQTQAFNFVGSAQILAHVKLSRKPLSDLTRFEKRVYSQNGEDGILEAIFLRIGATDRTFVEFGVADGSECNTRLLRKKGWTGLQMDPGAAPDSPHIRREFVTAENVEGLFEKYRVPKTLDLLSIDVDGNDYWIWKALTNWRPRVVVIEYNGTIPVDRSVVIPYDPQFVWTTNYRFGASLSALVKLARSKGYTLVACDSRGINAVFVDDPLVEGNFDPAPAELLFRRYRAEEDNWWKWDWVTV